MKSRIMFFGLLAMALQTGCATSTLPESVCLAQEESISDCGPAGYGSAGESDRRRRDPARSGEGDPPEGRPGFRMGDRGKCGIRSDRIADGGLGIADIRPKLPAETCEQIRLPSVYTGGVLRSGVPRHPASWAEELSGAHGGATKQAGSRCLRPTRQRSKGVMQKLYMT